MDEEANLSFSLPPALSNLLSSVGNFQDFMGNVAAPLSREEQVNALHSFSLRILLNLVFPHSGYPGSSNPGNASHGYVTWSRYAAHVSTAWWGEFAALGATRSAPAPGDGATAGAAAFQRGRIHGRTTAWFRSHGRPATARSVAFTNFWCSG